MNSLALAGIIVGGIVAIILVKHITRCVEVNREGHAERDRLQAMQMQAAVLQPATSGTHNVEMETVNRFLDGILREKPARFTPENLREFTGGYAERVGSGGFGVVYRGRFPNGVPVAVKVLNGTLDRRAEEQFMAEVGTAGRTYHINLVRLYGFCFDAATKALVYEYLENGSLDRVLFDAAGGVSRDGAHALAFDTLYGIVVGTAKGIRYLHEECQHRIIHYDIKPENVLLDAGMAPKVSDFGLARLCDREDTHLTITGARGTPGYAAPELWMPLPVTHKCDVYSYGMLLFEILGRRRNLDLHSRESQEWYPRWVWHRFEAGEMDAVLARAMAAGDMDDTEKAARMCKVALWCVQYRAEDRPSMGNVVRMLEGEDHIATPGNPFAHLATYSAGVMLSGDTTTRSDASSSRSTGR